MATQKPDNRRNDKESSEQKKGQPSVEQGNTRSDVGTDANPAVDATRVHTSNSDNKNGEELNSENANELITENEIAKRNREVGNVGTEHEDDNETDIADNYNL